MSGARGLLVHLAFSAAILVVLLGGGEAALRLWGPKNDSGVLHEALPDSPRRWRLRPGARGFVGGEPVTINSRGMRDREFAPEKPPGVVRVAVLGDSFTFGYLVRTDVTFPKVIEADLNRRAGAPRFEVMNFGVSGYDTIQEIATLREEALALDPDLVVVAFYLNDVGYPERFAAGVGRVRAEDAGADAKTPARIRLRRFLASHSRLAAFLLHRIAILVRSVIDVPYQGVVDYNRAFVEDGERWRASKEALREMKAIADSCGMGALVVLIPEMGNLNERYPFRAAHDSVRAYCGRIDVPFCDLLDGFMGMEGKTLWASYDDAHFNARGHRLAAEQIERALDANGLLGRAGVP